MTTTAAPTPTPQRRRSPTPHPIANAGADKTGTEGSVSFTFNCTDPGMNDTWSASVDWGDGSTDTTFASVTCNTATTFNASHTYADDDGSPFTVTADRRRRRRRHRHRHRPASTSTTSADRDRCSVRRRANEGDTKTYTYSWTDPGTADTFPAAGNSVDCGINGTASTVVFTPASKTGSFDCTWSDDSGAGTADVKATVTDDDGGADTDTINVTVANVAPTVTFVGPILIGERGPDEDLHVQRRGSRPGHLRSAPASPTAEPPTSTVTGSYTPASERRHLPVHLPGRPGNLHGPDAGQGLGQRLQQHRTQSVTVANANPALSNPVFTYNPFTGSASARINFSDPGWPDTHTAVFNWAGSTDAGTPSLIEHAPPDATGRFSSSHEFGPGCITGAVTVTVTDDDGGSATYTFAPAGTLARYSAVWQAPVKDGMRNVVKQGNVIPLKIRVTDCLGNSVVGKTLTVGVTEGVVYADDITDGTVILPTESVGSHTDGIMRYVDSHYMYNLATKQLKVGLPYTIVIREQGTNLLVTTAVIEPKK